MCRFSAYIGQDKLLLNEVLEEPENSLVKQSRGALEGTHGIHADGFGLSWYNNEIDEEPGIFKSTQPAWNDKNLQSIASKMRAHCFLAHVRACTVGDVNQNNCHPFSFNQYSMVHNGTIRHFDSIKRKMLHQLSDELFLQIKGNTDSECLFLLIIHFLQNNNYNLIEAVKSAFSWIIQAQKDLDDDHFSRINIAITNGHEFLGTRFSSKNQNCLSLHYNLTQTNNKFHSLLLCSEPLQFNSNRDWPEVPDNHLLYLSLNSPNLLIQSLDFN